MRLPGLIVLAALTSACVTSTTPTVPLNRDFTLAPGELIVIDETSIGIRFVRVTGDSRCPADAVCVLGGDAIVRIEVHPNHGEPATYELHTGSMRPVTRDRHVIALVEFGALSLQCPHDQARGLPRDSPRDPVGPKLHQGVSMNITELLLVELDWEAGRSRRALENMPEGKHDWKPHDKSMAFGYLAELVATIPTWVENGDQPRRARSQSSRRLADEARAAHHPCRLSAPA